MTAATGTSGTGALNVWEVYEELGFRPHSGQVPILEAEQRNRVVAAGRRFGKSELGGHELIPEALLTLSMRSELEAAGKARRFWIVGPEYTDSEKEFRVAYDGLKRLEVPFDKPGTYNDPHGGDMEISLWGGRFILEAKSGKHPETLVGEGLHGVVLAEAAKLKERVWTKFVRPTLADFNGWAFFLSSPEGRNWFYDLWMMGQDPNRPDWASWRRPSWMNPFVYPEGATDRGVERLRDALDNGAALTYDLAMAHGVDFEVASMVGDMSAESFNQEIGANFNEFVGRVFKEFDEEIHVGDFEYDPAWETYAAVDYGFTNPFVWLLIQVGPFGEVRVLDEMYESGLTIPEIAVELKRRQLVPGSLLRFYPDPAQPGDSKELSKYIKTPYGGGTGGMLSRRIDAIRVALKPLPAHLPADHPDKKPMLMINRRCSHTIREFGAYRYPKTVGESKSQDTSNMPEAPMKKDDHTPEALGRFFAGHFTRQLEKKRRSARTSTGKYN